MKGGYWNERPMHAWPKQLLVNVMQQIKQSKPANGRIRKKRNTRDMIVGCCGWSGISKKCCLASLSYIFSEMTFCNIITVIILQNVISENGATD